jgi:DNA-binding transcriptional ArsR family regulator
MLTLPAQAVRSLRAAAHAASDHTRDLLNRARRALTLPEVSVLELITGAWLSQAVVAAARLGIADALADGPRTLSELARALDADPEALARLLRCLAEHGLFAEQKDGRYTQTRLSAALRSDVLRSLHGFAEFVGSNEHRAHWEALDEAVRTGTPQVGRLRGRDFFAFARAEPRFGAVFQRAMTSLSALVEEPLCNAYPYGHFERLVDVGGGRGKLLGGLLARHRSLRGVLFDLPEVVEGALEVPSSVRTRLEVVGGSFFEHVPRGADGYLLKHILHDFADGDAARILHQVRRAMDDGGRVLVAEMLLPEGGRAHVGTLIDLEMLLSLGGRERTLRELDALLHDAGLYRVGVRATGTPLALVEATTRRAS